MDDHSLVLSLLSEERASRDVSPTETAFAASADEDVVTASPEDNVVAASPDENADAVLNVPRVATLLDVGRNTIYGLVARNQIPHRRLGKAIRFSRTAVMQWLSSWSSRDAKERQ